MAALLVVAAVAAVCAMLLAFGIIARPSDEAVRPVVSVLDPFPLPTRRPFRVGEELVYEFGWQGVQAAEFRMNLREEEKDGARYLVVNYEGHTLEEIALVWNYRLSGKTHLDPRTLLPSLSVSTSTKNEQTKRFTTTFDRSAGVAHTVTEKLYENERKERQTPFLLGLDLPGALLFIRALELPMGKPTVIEVVHSKRTYAVGFTPIRREKVDVKAGTFDALVVDVRVRVLGGTEEERAEEEDKFRKLRVWLSDDDMRLPVKMESEVFVGSVRAELVSVKP